MTFVASQNRQAGIDVPTSGSVILEDAERDHVLRALE
jgi:hypothetical protein